MSPLPTPDSLDELMRRTGADIRSPLLRALVDLYLQKPTHTAEEARHFSELVVRLLDQADMDTRIVMARRLASHPSVPAAVKQRLATDVPDIATPARPADRNAIAGMKSALLPQEPVSPAELSDLFFAAGAAERRLILSNLAYSPGPAIAVREDPAGEAARHLEAAALGRNIDAFARGLERWLGIGPTISRQIVCDPLGEPIVVAAKILGIAPDVLQRILLFINPDVGRSVSRVYQLAALYDAIDVQAAHVLAGIWCATDPQPAASAMPPGAAERGTRRIAPTRTTAPQRRGPPSAQAAALTRAKR